MTKKELAKAKFDAMPEAPTTLLATSIAPKKCVSCSSSARSKIDPFSPYDPIDSDGMLYFCHEHASYYAREWDVYGPEYWKEL